MKQKMKTITLLALTFFLAVNFLQAKDIEVQSFGNPDDRPIIFLHGGPGYHSIAFEKTTAHSLAASGFFVISYDRRGEGRNSVLPAAYTFQQTFEDIDFIYQKYNLQTASFIGHSFGGVVGLLFAEAYPEKVNSLFLVGAPVNMQSTLATIISKSKAIYEANEDFTSLNYIGMLEDMDKSSLQYSSYSFMHAMKNGFYQPSNPNESAIELYKISKNDSLLIAFNKKMDYNSPQGFWKNENYTTLDLTQNLNDLIKSNTKVYGLYGKEDGLFSEKQISDIQSIIGDKNLKYFENCSHSVFIDRQKAFISALKEWSK